MITRSHFSIQSAVIFSWRILLFSFSVTLIAYLSHHYTTVKFIEVPLSIVGIMGTALAIILGFRNSSAYDRWWEARRIWGEIVNESRTLTRQVITIVDPEKVPAALWNESVSIVHRQLAWIYALKLQLRGQQDLSQWEKEVKPLVSEKEYELVMSLSNKATQLMMMQGRAIKKINSDHTLDTYSYIQMDDTLTRLTNLQGGSERIKNTPLPKPYDYYTLAFLYIFVALLPFGIMNELQGQSISFLVFPVSIVVSWIFYQIYILGKVLSRPFDNLPTDVPLNALCRIIEIDLRQVLLENEIPKPITPQHGVLD
ncbi:MAG: hypothetical protein MH137_05085 [Flavobacteriales bacterium]|nr:hypothetical protein [Flavobacteriales bacterium]